MKDTRAERARIRRRRTTHLEVRVPTLTILKLLGTVLLVWVMIRLAPELLFLAFSFLFAIALEPVIAFAERYKVPRWAGAAGLGVTVVSLVALFAAFVAPPLVSQLAALGEDLPGLHVRVLCRLHPTPFLSKVIDQAFDLPRAPEVLEFVHRPLAIGMSALSAAMTGVLVVVMTLYFLIDGKGLYAWLIAYVPRSHRAKMAETVPAVSAVICAYVRGQLFVSLLFSIFVAILLSILRLPAVLPVALLAFFCDVIPVVGIIIATAPTVLLALADSPSKALIVGVAFLGYHMFETYVIVPRVYGASMRLSTLAVLLALLIGASLDGIVGAILLLPVVAAYPILERIWLRDYLSRDLIRDHEALGRSEGGADKDHVVEAVIQGSSSSLPPEVRDPEG